jgi:hypothetical protein
MCRSASWDFLKAGCPLVDGVCHQLLVLTLTIVGLALVEDVHLVVELTHLGKPDGCQVDVVPVAGTETVVVHVLPQLELGIECLSRERHNVRQL